MDVALISPVSPVEPKDGHSLAVQSDAYAIIDNGLTLGVIAFTYDGHAHPASSAWETRYINARSGGFASRLLRGLKGKIPPSAERLYTAEAYSEIRRALREWHPELVIVDDLSVGGFIPTMRELLPRAKVFLRSHNVMQDVRREQLSRTSGPTKIPLAYECAKYTEFEREVVRQCDRHWAITTADAARMKYLYKRPCETLTVSVAIDQYSHLRVESARRNAFVHVGTVDFRRRSDLKAFLDASWPRIIKNEPDATLTFAGNIHGKPIEARNVNYLGNVPTDAAVYSRGRFSLNFQSTTGGVKLKTLTSMAAGRVLISTPQGVEGLSVQSGTHYSDLHRALETDELTTFMRDVSLAARMADSARQYVRERHSRKAVARTLRGLLSETHEPAL